MFAAVAVAFYLVCWSLLRITALLMAKPARSRKRSPWFTRVVLTYCFIFSVGFVAASTWSGGGMHNDNPVRLIIGGVLVLLALITDSCCLLSLRSLYALEMEIKECHVVVRSGLYRFIRHPIYLSNIVGFIGLCTLMNHWAAWVVVPAHMFCFLLMARAEESFLIFHLGQAYEKYRAETRWMFLPGII